MTRDELLRALTVERYTNPWWKTPATEADDSELARGMRRRELVEADADYRKRLAREAA